MLLSQLVLAVEINLERDVLYLKATCENQCLGFPGGTVVKNPPVNAGDMGSSPGPERSHMLQSN